MKISGNSALTFIFQVIKQITFAELNLLCQIKHEDDDKYSAVTFGYEITLYLFLLLHLVPQLYLSVFSMLLPSLKV